MLDNQRAAFCISQCISLPNPLSLKRDKYLFHSNSKSSIIEYYLSTYLLNFYDSLTLLLSITSLFCYFKSLEGCVGTQVECLAKLKPSYFFTLGIYGIIAGSTLSLCLLLIFFKRSKLYHLFYLSILYTILILNDFGSSLAKHGSYNFYFLIIIIIAVISLLLLFTFIMDMLKRLNFLTALITLVIVTYLVLTNIPKLSSTSCDNFYMGLGKQNITNIKGEDKCTMKYPKKCIMSKMSGLFDISYYLRKQCSNRDKREKENFIQFFRGDLKKANWFGFPMSQRFPLKEQKNINDFNTKVLDNVFDMNNNIYNVTPEVSLKFNERNEGEIIMKLIKNETLIKEREANRFINETAKPPLLYKNILFIYIDAISRNHFIRKMKHLTNFIEDKLYHPNITSNKQKHSTFQFLKYNNINSYTQINVGPMFYGKAMNTNGGNHVIEKFKKQGYITGQSLNLCSREVFAVEKHYHVSKIVWSDFDHENVAMFCDPNYYNRKDPYPLNRGPFSILRRCLYGKDTYEYVFEYAEQFWTAYKDQPKFFRMGFIDAHESTGEVVKYLDEPLTNFLKNWNEKGFLDNTMIFFVSDHGNNMGEFYKLISDDFEMEKTLGTLFIMIPKIENKEEEDKIIDGLYYNMQKLITPYDLFDTMVHMAYYGNETAINEEKGDNGQSLFTRINGGDRNCRKYKKDMKTECCRCTDF